MSTVLPVVSTYRCPSSVTSYPPCMNPVGVADTVHNGVPSKLDTRTPPESHAV